MKTSRQISRHRGYNNIDEDDDKYEGSITGDLLDDDLVTSGSSNSSPLATPNTKLPGQEVFPDVVVTLRLEVVELHHVNVEARQVKRICTSYSCTTHTGCGWAGPGNMDKNTGFTTSGEWCGHQDRYQQQ